LIQELQTTQPQIEKLVRECIYAGYIDARINHAKQQVEIYTASAREANSLQQVQQTIDHLYIQTQSAIDALETEAKRLEVVHGASRKQAELQAELEKVGEKRSGNTAKRMKNSIA